MKRRTVEQADRRGSGFRRTAAVVGLLMALLSTTAMSCEITEPGSFAGTIVADEYIGFLGSDYLGVTAYSDNPLSKIRLINGKNARQLPDGRLVFRRGCGRDAHEILIATTDLVTTQLTPCSNTIPNPGASPTDFEFSALSPDERYVAVEVRFFLNGGNRYNTQVFDTATRQSVATFEGAVAPMWYPDGRLLLSTTDWFRVADPTDWSLTRLPGAQNGGVNNPSISPDGTQIAFEFNQQIWVMNADGSNIRAEIVGGAALRYPVWAPNGQPVLAYLFNIDDNDNAEGIFFTDIEADVSWSVDYSSLLAPLAAPQGPLSWNH
jgi:hypothetical protein